MNRSFLFFSLFGPFVSQLIRHLKNFTMDFLYYEMCQLQIIVPSKVPTRNLSKPKFQNMQWNRHNGQSTFRSLMLFMICTMGMWILNHGQVKSIQEDLFVVPCRAFLGLHYIWVIQEFIIFKFVFEFLSLSLIHELQILNIIH